MHLISTALTLVTAMEAVMMLFFIGAARINIKLLMLLLWDTYIKRRCKYIDLIELIWAINPKINLNSKLTNTYSFRLLSFICFNFYFELFKLWSSCILSARFITHRCCTTMTTLIPFIWMDGAQRPWKSNPMSAITLLWCGLSQFCCSMIVSRFFY